MLLSCGKINNSSNTSADIDGGVDSISKDTIIKDKEEYDDLGSVTAIYCCDNLDGYDYEKAYLYVRTINGNDSYYLSLSEGGKKYRVVRNERKVDNLFFFPNACAQIDDGIIYYFDIQNWPSQSLSDTPEPSSSESGSSSRTVIVEQPNQPRPMQEWVACGGCNGSGQCVGCQGTGTIAGISSVRICGVCGGNGKCSMCAGHGGHNEVRYY